VEGTVIYTSDPRAGYRELQESIDAAIKTVLESPGYILGEAVPTFEEGFARFVGVEHGVGVNNGTDAIHLALRSLGIGHGDEVITVSHTAVATVAAICMAGATPVLADVDPETRTLDPGRAAELITQRTKAIVAVHLYGHPVQLDLLMELCTRHGLYLIEDCAQAHAATWGNAQVGTFGHLAAFSFYPTKNLGAIGDAGMVLTRDPELAQQLRLLRQYGWERPQFSTVQGWNSRMDTLQAAILSVKLTHLDRYTARRRELAKLYDQGLTDLPIKLPVELWGCKHAYHLYVIELQDEATRDALKDHLAVHGIIAGIHYPFGVHQQPAYQGQIKAGPLPVTERLVRTVLSLPLYPELSNEDAQRVIAAVSSYFPQAR